MARPDGKCGRDLRAVERELARRIREQGAPAAVRAALGTLYPWLGAVTARVARGMGQAAASREDARHDAVFHLLVAADDYGGAAGAGGPFLRFAEVVIRRRLGNDRRCRRREECHLDRSVRADELLAGAEVAPRADGRPYQPPLDEDDPARAAERRELAEWLRDRLEGLDPARGLLVERLAEGDSLTTAAEAAGLSYEAARWCVRELQARLGPGLRRFLEGDNP